MPNPRPDRHSPELLRLAEEVQRSNRPRVLKRRDEEPAVVVPLQRHRRPTRRTGTTTRDDPLWRMVGTGKSGIAGGISGRKYEHFSEAFGSAP